METGPLYSVMYLSPEYASLVRNTVRTLLLDFS